MVRQAQDYIMIEFEFPSYLLSLFFANAHNYRNTEHRNKASESNKSWKKFEHDFNDDQIYSGHVNCSFSRDLSWLVNKDFTRRYLVGILNIYTIYSFS